MPPDPPDPIVIAFHWANGIKQLEECGVTTELTWADLGWLTRDGYFDCGGTTTSGCYDTSGFITYNTQEPDAIRHETGHAVLHQMGAKNWRLWQHDPEVECEGVR